MNRVLICVPTYNRPDMVREVLEYELPYYKNYPLDLCFYDSSTNNETWQLIQEYQAKKQMNIIYRTESSQLSLDYKLVEILKDIEYSRYAYLWLINDSVSITREALDLVMPLLEEDYDLVRLPVSGEGNPRDLICQDPVEWFHKCSQSMAHMASTVMSTTLLKKAPHDWEYLTQRYIGSNELGPNHGYFFMVAFFLEQILKLENFKGIFIGNRVKWRRDSPLKGERSYWKHYVFEAWAKSYVDTIRKLPDRYTEKDAVIRRSDNITPGRFSKSMLIRYRLNGLYTWKTFVQYRRYFPLVSTVPTAACFAISCTPVFFLKKIWGKSNVDESQWEEQLEKILSKIGKTPIIVYGAGLYGERVADWLIKNGYQEQILGVAVTNKLKNIKSLRDIQVYAIEELLAYSKDAAVIIAALPAAAQSIRKVLRSKGFKEYHPLLGF